MKIQTFQLIEGAKEAIGLTVIIDVFRAFSLECYLFARGAEKIYPVGKTETAFALQKKDRELLLIGERNEKIILDPGNGRVICSKHKYGKRKSERNSFQFICNSSYCYYYASGRSCR